MLLSLQAYHSSELHCQCASNSRLGGCYHRRGLAPLLGSKKTALSLTRKKLVGRSRYYSKAWVLVLCIMPQQFCLLKNELWDDLKWCSDFCEICLKILIKRNRLGRYTNSNTVRISILYENIDAPILDVKDLLPFSCSTSKGMTALRVFWLRVMEGGSLVWLDAVQKWASLHKNWPGQYTWETVTVG